MEALILLDTTELLRVMPRKLHAAWAELCGTKARMPPTVADELAPAGVLRSSAEEVIRATVKNIGTLVRTGGSLPNASARLLNELENHPNPVGLVERTRRRFPSPTITTDRTHPSYPAAA